MEQADNGASATARATHEPSPDGLGHSVSVPDADEQDGFYDDCGRYWPHDAEWCDRCQGMGTEECLCAGDFCCCGWGERDCQQCGGDGYFVPTAAFKKAREENAKWWAGLWREMSERPRCTLGVGCDESGVCYADAHGEPGQCPRHAQGMAAPSGGETGTGSTEQEQ